MKLVMLAGEASGDFLGGEVLAALHERVGSLEATGVGGKAMQAQGLRSVFDMSEMTVFGFSAAIKAYFRLKKRAAELIDHIISERPDVVVTIDNKGFSLRFAKALKSRMAKEGWSVPIVHLVAPTVWAWGAWRARSIASAVDRLLCLFPFEVAYFTEYGLDTVAVGHPSADIKRPLKNEARAGLGLGQEDEVLVLIPGSRCREIAKLLPVMLEAVRLIRCEKPHLRVLLPAADAVASQIDGMVAAQDRIEIFNQDSAIAVMASGDYGLICSGTVTLEAALCGLAGAVYYEVDWLTYGFGLVLFDRSKLVLANAVSGVDIYDYRLNRQFTAASMAEAALAYLSGAPQAHSTPPEDLLKAISIGTAADTAAPDTAAGGGTAGGGEHGFASRTAEAILGLIPPSKV